MWCMHLHTQHNQSMWCMYLYTLLMHCHTLIMQVHTSHIQCLASTCIVCSSIYILHTVYSGSIYITSAEWSTYITYSVSSKYIYVCVCVCQCLASTYIVCSSIYIRMYILLHIHCVVAYRAWEKSKRYTVTTHFKFAAKHEYAASGWAFYYKRDLLL